MSYTTAVPLNINSNMIFTNVDCEGRADHFSKASTAVIDDVSNSADSNENVECIHKSPQRAKQAPFLGGYKHKLTGITYLHATTQTVRSPWNDIIPEKCTRESQCVITKDQIQQTARDAATQVEVRNILIRTSSDKVSTSSDSYVFADDIQSEFLSKIVIMQKFVRRWLAQKELQRRRKIYEDKLFWEEEQKRVKRKQDSEWLKSLHRRKLYPIAEDDFILLFSDLQNWWECEAQTITETKTGAHQQEAMWMLVNEEVKKIDDINRTKTAVENKKVFDHRQKLLYEVGKPKLWKAYKEKVHVITENSVRGQDLQNLYTTLSMRCVSIQDRIDALQTLIQLIQKYNSHLTNTLLQLAQREIDLLLRGIKPRNLEGLRSRIQDLFWQYVKQPIFNPEMRSLRGLKKVGDTESHILCCAGCKQFYTLPPNSMNEAVGKSILGNCFVKCKKCLYLENEGWIRKDTELYKKIIKLLIEEEEKKSSVSSLIYVLQPCDIKHLVETIWKRQSCLSGAADEKDLELVRYNVEEDWTPWNCLLVTREEAAIMSRIPNPKATYDDDFKKFVYQRHVAARSYFSTIPRFLPYITKLVLKDFKNFIEDEDV